MISRLVDLELKATASAELFEHLGKCAQCREFFDNLMRLNLELDNAQAPVALEREIGDQLSEKLGKKRELQVIRTAQIRFDRWRTAALLALMVLITGLFWSMTLPMQSEDRFGVPRETPQTEMPNYQP
jgi:predicted anti-sigma-YlaC factor YlaD